MFDVLHGFYSTRILECFHRVGLLESLSTSHSAAELAANAGYDPTTVGALLAYLTRETDILIKHGEHYKLRRRYCDYSKLGFQIDKFVGAFGEPFDKLHLSLRRRDLGRRFVNDNNLGLALRQVAASSNDSMMAELIASLGAICVLDLGCGPGSLLVRLSRRVRQFEGWGLDRSAEMCRVARREAKREGFAARIHVVHGDVRAAHRAIPLEARKQIQVLHAGSIFNAFWRKGSNELVTLLKNLKTAFPKRLLIVSDYCGCFDTVGEDRRTFSHTVLHDLAQIVSAQGVPPPTVSGWLKVYRAAGCRLVRKYQGEMDGFRWFVHVVEF